MGTAPDRDYADKEWFAQDLEPLPPYIRLLDLAALGIGGIALLSFCLAVLCLVTP